MENEKKSVREGDFVEQENSVRRKGKKVNKIVCEVIDNISSSSRLRTFWTHIYL